MDAIHFKVRDDGRIVNKVAYIVLGVTLDGTKDMVSNPKTDIIDSILLSFTYVKKVSLRLKDLVLIAIVE